MVDGCREKSDLQLDKSRVRGGQCVACVVFDDSDVDIFSWTQMFFGLVLCFIIDRAVIIWSIAASAALAKELPGKQMVEIR